ncbi:MAG: hypothetical protein QW420_02935 [Candidatus Caldarchaeum sp.]
MKRGLRSIGLAWQTTGWLRTATLMAVQLAAMALTAGTAHAAGAGSVASLIRDSVQGFQQLLLLIALALLGSGIAIKFLPTGSHRTKDAAGQLIDNALIMGGLIALGLYLVGFVGEVAKTAAGVGEKPPIGGAWQVGG